jgi:hypothetical protein
MSKVNVTLREFFTSPGNVLVTVTSVLVASLNVVSGSSGVLPGAQSKRTSASGVVQFDLMTGRYRVSAVSSSAAGGLAYAVLIDVPDDNLEYEHTELIVDGATLFDPALGAGSPNAAEAVSGLIRLAAGADGEASPRVVYTKAQVDALLAASGGGLVKANTVADVKAIASVLLKVAGGAFVWGGAAAGDGLGGIYRFKNAGAEVDEGIGGRYLRPDDYAGAGVNQGTLEKFL